MPRINGFELLAWLREQEHLRHVPAVVLSSSFHESDMRGTLELGARQYFVKPRDFHHLVLLVKRLHAAWIVPHCREQATSFGG